jgi:uncharacterized membrane protein HdeD (DUF308 family)
MKSLLQKTSDSLIFSGWISIFLGLFCTAWNRWSIHSLAWALSMCLGSQGLFQITSSIRVCRYEDRWWLLFFSGFIQFASAILTAALSSVSSVYLIQVMSASWTVTGILQLFGAYLLRKEIYDEKWLASSGLFSIGSGLIFSVYQSAEAGDLSDFIGIYILAWGGIVLQLGYKARNWITSAGQRFRRRYFTTPTSI